MGEGYYGSERSDRGESFTELLGGSNVRIGNR